MGFLEKLGRRHFPPTSELEKVSSRRLKIWVWFFPCAAAFPSVIILLYGQVAVGLMLLVPSVMFGGFIAWVRFQQVSTIVDKRDSQPGAADNGQRKKARPPTNVAKRDRSKRAKKRRKR
jgi:hypothetical protein